MPNYTTLGLMDSSLVINKNWKHMKNLKEILIEELDYWKGIKEGSKNRLVIRTAHRNITKRRIQLNKLSRGLPIKRIA